MGNSENGGCCDTTSRFCEDRCRRKPFPDTNEHPLSKQVGSLSNSKHIGGTNGEVNHKDGPFQTDATVCTNYDILKNALDKIKDTGYSIISQPSERHNGYYQYHDGTIYYGQY